MNKIKTDIAHKILSVVVLIALGKEHNEIRPLMLNGSHNTTETCLGKRRFAVPIAGHGDEVSQATNLFIP